MKDLSSNIFGNQMDAKTIQKACKTKAKFIKKFGDDSNVTYHLKPVPVPCLSEMGVQNLVHSDEPLKLPDNAVIVGNIRMGFGHYRISIAMASCAKALGYEPYWFDLASFDATGSKVIRYQNDLYSTASKISQKSKLFNKFFWEPLNCEGFKKITYNAPDQKSSELMANLLHDFPKDVPYVATHVWPSQAAVHAGLTHVVNAIPDNWPMGLHLSEGALHAVQTPFAYFGYKTLHHFAKTPLKGIPESDLFMVGHYVDHELVSNVEADCKKRLERLEKGEPLRLLLTVGGAGAGAKQFLGMMKHLLPLVEQKKVAIYLNYGDHLKMHEFLCKKIPGFEGKCKCFFNQYDDFKKEVKKLENGYGEGITLIQNNDIFQAVYSTNLLMRVTDLMITKPSELVFYPIPKIFQRHIGGHEVYGAIHGREIGDATLECPDEKSMNEMIDIILADKDAYRFMIKRIIENKNQGLYNGAYEAVKLAVKGRE